MARFAVIGLGRFGQTLARTLAKNGAEVIAIDTSLEAVDDVREAVTLSLRMDATDDKALLAQDIDKMDAVIVAIGQGFEAKSLCVAVLKQMGVKRIICRAESEVMARIIKAIGADEVIYPEEESALRLAQRLVAPNIVDYVELAEGHSLVQFEAPRAFHGRQIVELDLRRKYEVNLVAVKRRMPIKGPDGKVIYQEKVIDIPRPTDKIEPNDILIVVGSDENILKLPQD
jgi:trk system potassium uptake protein TrkA